MEGKIKKVRTVAIILLSILLSLIAFGGLFIKTYGVWKNILPEFNYGMELGGIRELRFILDTSEEEKEIYLDADGNYMGDVAETASSQPTISLENPDTGETQDVTNQVAENAVVSETTEETSEENIEYKTETRTIKTNPEERITIQNFEKAKKIIQQRLETINLYEYNIRQDTITGEILVEVPDDGNLQLEEALISTVGDLTLVDYQTGIILIDDSHVKNVSLLGSNENDMYQSYLQIEFDEEGTEKLKEISNKYQTITDENGDEATTYVSVNMDGTALITTYFGDEIATGLLQIPVGEAHENYEDYVASAQELSAMATVLDGEKMPLAYTLNSDNFVKSTISDEMVLIVKVGFAIAILVVSIIMIIKYKTKAIKLVATSVAYIAILSLIIRYTDVKITLNSLVAFLSVIVINYVFNFKILKELQTNSNEKLALANVMKELYLTIIPVCIIAVIFTFMSSVVISSIGMVLFWGLLVQALFSLLILI